MTAPVPPPIPIDPKSTEHAWLNYQLEKTLREQAKDISNIRICVTIITVAIILSLILTTCNALGLG